MLVNKFTGLGGYYTVIQKDSVTKIKLVQQEIAKIVLTNSIVKHSHKGATVIDGSSTDIEAQIRKAIFHRVSVTFNFSRKNDLKIGINSSALKNRLKIRQKPIKVVPFSGIDSYILRISTRQSWHLICLAS